jgi:hypothetical protein
MECEIIVEEKEVTTLAIDKSVISGLMEYFDEGELKF